MAPRTAERTSGLFLRLVHRNQDMTWLVACGGAGGAVGDGEVVFQGQHQGFGIDAGDGEIDDMGQGAVGVAIEDRIEWGEGGEEFLAEGQALICPSLPFLACEFGG